MTVQVLRFVQSTQTLELPELGRLTLCCEWKERHPLDLTVSAFGKEVRIPDFASSFSGGRTGQREPRRIPYLQYALGTPSWPFVVLAGMWNFVLVNFGDQSIDVFRFFREEKEDQGFWRIDVFPVKEGLVVLYESGVALIDHAGKLAWHKRISWNDIMFARDEEELHFGGDIGKGSYEWSIRLRDGVTRGNPPS
jgi:hypothetical protein